MSKDVGMWVMGSGNNCPKCGMVLRLQYLGLLGRPYWTCDICKTKRRV